MRIYRSIFYKSSDESVSRLKLPYTNTIYKYENNDSTGSIEFDGYFYIDDEMFPVRMTLEETLYLEYRKKYTIIDASGAEIIKKKRIWIPIKSQINIIEVYARDHILNTSEYWTDEEVGRMCCFPTEHQRLHFRVLSVTDTREVGKEYMRDRPYIHSSCSNYQCISSEEADGLDIKGLCEKIPTYAGRLSTTGDH